MQCIMKPGNSSLCTSAGAKDMEGGSAHQLLLSILWHTQQFQQLEGCFTLAWLPGSLCFPCSWRHLATADGWFSLTGLFLIGLTYIKCMFLNTGMSLMSHCIWMPFHVSIPRQNTSSKKVSWNVTLILHKKIQESFESTLIYLLPETSSETAQRE